MSGRCAAPHRALLLLFTMDDSNTGVAPMSLLRGRSRLDAKADVDRAFEVLYETCFDRVYALARWQLGDADAARDIASQTFLKAYEGRDRAPSGEAMTLWLFRIARNTIIDYLRVHRRRALKTTSIDERVDVAAEQSDGPEASVHRREQRVLLLKALDVLPERDRAMLALKFGAQRTNREICRILDMSEGAVAMRLLRALRKLRAEFGDLT